MEFLSAYGTESLGHLLVLFEFAGGTEVDDLDVGVLLLGVEEEVLRLEIAMDDVVLMAVDDGGEDLFHVFCCHFLREIRHRFYLVEELTARAVSARE